MINLQHGWSNKNTTPETITEILEEKQSALLTSDFPPTLVCCQHLYAAFLYMLAWWL